MRRAGRPGLIGLAARTAVVAGTANAVTNASAAKQQQAAVNRQNAAIADQMRISVKTVEAQITKALRRIRETLLRT